MKQEEKKAREVIEDMLPDEEMKINISLTPEFYQFKKEYDDTLKKLKFLVAEFPKRIHAFVKIR